MPSKFLSFLRFDEAKPRKDQTPLQHFQNRCSDRKNVRCNGVEEVCGIHCRTRTPLTAVCGLGRMLRCFLLLIWLCERNVNSSRQFKTSATFSFFYGLCEKALCGPVRVSELHTVHSFLAPTVAKRSSWTKIGSDCIRNQTRRHTGLQLLEETKRLVVCSSRL